MPDSRPISYGGLETLSFRQIDAINDFTKGTAFRLFKRWRDHLEEGQDYLYLPADTHGALIQSLKSEGRVYQSTTHLVLITREGYDRLQAWNQSR